MKEQNLITCLNCETLPPYPLYVFVVYFHFFISLNFHPVAPIPLLSELALSLGSYSSSLIGLTCLLCSSSLYFIFFPFFSFSCTFSFLFLFIFIFSLHPINSTSSLSFCLLHAPGTLLASITFSQNQSLPTPFPVQLQI